MPLDHYVSQVHLRKFYSTELSDRKMYAVRKKDQFQFICGSEDVCRFDEWSTNKYFDEERVLEEFLLQIEPRYNYYVENISTGRIDADTILAISGFAAFVMSCSPTAIRTANAPLEGMLGARVNILDASGELPAAPDALGGKQLSELLADGTVKLEIDEKYPQAIGISNIIDTVSRLGNSALDIFSAKSGESKFFTSDFPAAIDPSNRKGLLSRLVPLTPDLLVRITPRQDSSSAEEELDFKNLKFRFLNASEGQIRYMNQRIVQCAEEIVFFSEKRPWIDKFVKKNAMFHVESHFENIPSGNGYLTNASLQIARKKSN